MRFDKRLVTVLVLLLHACAVSPDDPGVDDTAVVEDPSLGEDPTDPPIATEDSADPNELDELDEDTAAPTAVAAAAKLYQNPVAASCADPGVIQASGPEFYTVCTGGNFARYSSANLVHWTADGTIFTTATKPTWGDGKWWAPEIHKLGNKYIAYFVANRHATNRMCIGAATASSPSGPFEDLGHPLVCDGTYGLIDPNVFTDDNGKHYLYYKIDGNALSPPRKTIIYGVELTASGLGFVGVRHKMIENTLSWEGLVTEAPFVVRRGGYYYMFYSGAAYDTDRYSIGVARAKGPLGPFRKRSAPILKSNATWKGPGHNSFVRAGNQAWLVYAAWHKTANVGNRQLLLDRVGWTGGWPFIGNGTPSTGLKAAPIP
jgi:arabinan endo-1,5-alpha-L-arabinosidase